MELPVLSISDRCYRILLRAYPKRFRQRFEREMGQVFHTSLCEAYRTRRTVGIVSLWLPTLWDWAITSLREQVSSLLGKDLGMTDTLAFDRQLGDSVWMMAMGLLAGYSLEQAIEALSQETPEPSRSAYQRVWDDLRSGKSFETAFANLQRAVPSRLLSEVIGLIQANQKTGGNLGEMLLMSVDRLIKQGGSDPADYAFMRKLVIQLGAPLPEWARDPELGSSEPENVYRVGDVAALDRQLGDAVWMLSNTLLGDEVWVKSGELLTYYGLFNAIYQLTLETPEPTRSVFKQVGRDLGTGMGIQAAFTNLQNGVPSRLVSELVGVVLEQQANVDQLGEKLQPLIGKFNHEAGSDPAMYGAMRTLASQVERPLPAWVK